MLKDVPSCVWLVATRHRNVAFFTDACSRFSALQADKLLSPEFQPIIAELIAFLAPGRQLLMYSATFPITIKDFKVCVRFDNLRCTMVCFGQFCRFVSR